MSDQQVDQQNELQTTVTEDAAGSALHARRRLFKTGASVIGLSLASRPVLAWHCKSPSAWGSEQLNPNTSLKTNAGHTSYTDETWTIVNWRDNTDRNSMGIPWSKVYQYYPSIKVSANTTNGAFDYTKLTIDQLRNAIPGFVIPNSPVGTTKVKTLLTSGTEKQKYMIVAQLNYDIHIKRNSPYDLDRCLTATELQKMATGTYSPPGVNITWNWTQIRQYLYDNWVVRPS